MTIDVEKDVTVIGAGLVGISCALHLQEQGFSVRMIDRGEPGQSTSFGNAGILSAWSCVPTSMPGLWKSVPKWLLDPMGPVALRWSYLPKLIPWLLQFQKYGRPERINAIADAMLALNNTTIEETRYLLRDTGQEALVEEGCLLKLYRNPANAHLDALDWKLRLDRGADIEILSGGEIQDLEPDVTTLCKKAIMIKGGGRVINPGRLGLVLAEKFKRQGGVILQADVLKLLPGEDGRTIIKTSSGDITPDKLVVSAGAWSARLLKDLGLKVPLESERGFHVVFADPGVSCNNSLIDVDGNCGVNAMEPGMRIAGMVEFAGLDSAPNYDRAHKLGILGKKLFPKMNTEQPTYWMGHRPSLPDSLPAIGAVENHPNLYLAFGHAHLGLTGAALTGRIIGQLLAGKKTSIDVAPYNVSRFE